MTDGERARRRRFDTLFASYSSDIVAYCGWRAVSTSDAQDAAAEVFLVAWRRLDELPEGDAARAWLYATAGSCSATRTTSTPTAAPPRRNTSPPCEDTGGATLRRITDAMTRPTTRRLQDGSTVYRGAVAAGRIARETGVKEGRPIRVLPFGYVAHDEAADPADPLDVALTVGADGIVRQLTVTWGAGASPWSYSVAYSDLGATPAPVAAADARPLRETLRTG